MSFFPVISWFVYIPSLLFFFSLQFTGLLLSLSLSHCGFSLEIHLFIFVLFFCFAVVIFCFSLKFVHCPSSCCFSVGLSSSSPSCLFFFFFCILCVACLSLHHLQCIGSLIFIFCNVLVYSSTELIYSLYWLIHLPHFRCILLVVGVFLQFLLICYIFNICMFSSFIHLPPPISPHTLRCKHDNSVACMSFVFANHNCTHIHVAHTQGPTPLDLTLTWRTVLRSCPTSCTTLVTRPWCVWTRSLLPMA